MTTMTNTYENRLKNIIKNNSSFKKIVDFNICEYPENGKIYIDELISGKELPMNHNQLNAYMAAYGEMHLIKLNYAFENFFEKVNLNNKSCEVYDWGSGQAIGACSFIDFIKSNKLNIKVNKTTLIEPSKAALNRGINHINFLNNISVESINSKIDIKMNNMFKSDRNEIKIHIFSNILDLSSLNQSILFENIISNFKGVNYFICVSPKYSSNKLTKFSTFFGKKEIIINEKGYYLDEKIFRPYVKVNGVLKLRVFNEPYDISIDELIFKTIL